jgi:RNase P subunit RPR2
MFVQEDNQKHCPQCRTIMVLQKVVPKLASLAELRTYKCLKCAHVIRYELDHHTAWAQYAFDF